MKITKTWFKTEIEITPKEISEIEFNLYPGFEVGKWLHKILKELF